MTDFDEALLGRLANDAGTTLRDVKRRTRELPSAALQREYNAEQASAAQAVAAALARVDDAFSANCLSDPFPYCDCCTDPAFVARLATTPRDALSEDDMAAVAGSLLYTLGGVSDFAYFMPRFCSDSLGSPLYDVDSVFARLRLAGFESWPDSQTRPVRAFLLAQWRFSLLLEPNRDLSSLSDPWLVILDAICSVDEIESALGAWETTHANSADARLFELLDRLEVGDTAIGIVGVGGYAENAGAYAKLSRWLRSPAVSARIGAVLESSRATDPDAAERIDGVLASLRLMI